MKIKSDIQKLFDGYFSQRFLAIIVNNCYYVIEITAKS